MEIYDNVLELIGNTPLVRLSNLMKKMDIKSNVLAKVEYLNPGGSIKDRIALRMVEEAERKGLLKPGGTIVEPTSGNTGVGLALVACLKGYKMVFVMADKQSEEKRALLRAYGAEVVICPTAVPRESPESYYSVAERLTREIPGAFQPNQYFNQNNPRSHYETTGPEIWKQTEGKITHLVCGVGTGGTITGTGRYLKEKNPAIQVIGADPEGSIFTGPVARPYKTEGIGEDFMPGTLDTSVVDRWIMVTDRDAFQMTRRLTREEGILTGGSSGTALWAALEVAQGLKEDDILVVILPDSGKSYLSKIYNDFWMRENGFLDRFSKPSRVDELLGMRGEKPKLVSVRLTDTVRQAIEKLQEYGISQMPVSRTDEIVDVHDIVGSIQERSLLDKVFRNPEMVDRAVEAVMEGPFPLVDVHERIESIFPLLSAGSSVLVEHNGKPVGVITRTDLLDFVAHGSTGVTHPVP